jgi:uncharacterized protein DUF4209
MLGEAAVEGALGAGLAVSLKRLYLDPYGPNYRNEIAHGADDPSEHQFQASMLTALGILSVALRAGDRAPAPIDQGRRLPSSPRVARPVSA